MISDPVSQSQPRGERERVNCATLKFCFHRPLVFVWGVRPRRPCLACVLGMGVRPQKQCMSERPGARAGAHPRPWTRASPRTGPAQRPRTGVQLTEKHPGGLTRTQGHAGGRRGLAGGVDTARPGQTRSNRSHCLGVWGPGWDWGGAGEPAVTLVRWPLMVPDLGAVSDVHSGRQFPWLAWASVLKAVGTFPAARRGGRREARPGGRRGPQAWARLTHSSRSVCPGGHRPGRWPLRGSRV